MNRTRNLAHIAIGALLSLTLVAGPASADFTTWAADLSGSESSATGTATLVADSDLQGQPGFLTLTAEYFGLSGPIIEVAFYSGAPSGGGTFIWAVGTANPLVEDVWMPLPQNALFTQALFGGYLYLNVATGDAKALGFPDGEIEGVYIDLGTVDNEVSSWGGIKALYR